MPDIIGQTVDQYVLKQVSTRQQFYGVIGERSESFHQYSTSRTAWIKLASGVKLKPNKFPGWSSGGIYPAQKFTLFNGTSTRWVL